MEKEFVTYEQALALKELGFDEECFGWYDSLDKNLWLNTESKQTLLFHKSLSRFSGSILAPIYQQAFKWFRDKHNLDLHIKLNWRQSDFISYILSVNYPTIYDIDFDTYEEAEEFAINVLIQIAEEQELERNL